MTWSRGMSRMSGILILSYRLKEVISSYVLHCFWIKRIVHISATRCLIEMGFESKCSILNGKVTYIEKSKLNIANMWLIPLDRVTYVEDFLHSTMWFENEGCWKCWPEKSIFCFDVVISCMHGLLKGGGQGQGFIGK